MKQSQWQPTTLLKSLLLPAMSQLEQYIECLEINCWTAKLSQTRHTTSVSRMSLFTLFGISGTLSGFHASYMAKALTVTKKT